MTDLIAKFPYPVLRRSQALALAKEFGISQYTFEQIVDAPGFAGRKRICGSRDHYYRDVLIQIFAPQGKTEDDKPRMDTNGHECL